MKAALSLPLLLACCAGHILGHELSPTTLNLSINGRAGQLTLSNSSNERDCTTTVSITVTGDAVKVEPTITQYSTPPDFQATFTVTPQRIGTATIVVRWVAGTSATCSGSGSPSATVTVADIPTPPPPVHEKQVIEPVSMATGAEINSWVDLRLRGPLPIYFERYYYSALQSEGQASSALGANWMHNYDLKLSATATTATVVFLQGEVIRFQNSGGAWSLATASPLGYQLVQTGTTYRMLDPGSKLVYAFDGATGRLDSIQDRNGNAQTLTYSSGRPARVSDGAGGTLDLAYNTAGNLISVTDQSGRSLGFAYTGGVLTGFTDAGGRATTYQYSGNALLTAARLPRGNAPYTQTYDASGRVTTVADAAGNRHTFTYDAANGQSTMTDPLSQVWRFVHNKRDLTQQTDPAGNVRGFTYDANSRLASQRDGAGNTTSWTYAAGGSIATTENADGTRAAFTYTASTLNGFTYYDLTTIGYADGATETFRYDARGNVVSRTGRNGQQWTATYNALGQPLTLTAPNGGSIAIAYSQDGTSAPASIQFPATGAVALRTDRLKRITGRTLAGGAAVSYTYDAYDRILTKTDETGGVTSYAYDVNGQVASITDPAGGTIRFTRSGTDQVATATDAAGRAVTLRYDALDRLAAAVFADGGSVQAGYDAAGNLTSITDGEGKIWRQSFDRAGNLTGAVNPSGGRTTLTVDATGRVTAATTPAGRRVALAYDTMGRVTTFTDPGGNATRITYDRSGAPVSVTLPGEIGARYARDSMGRVTAVTDPNGNEWRFGYDAAGRIQSIADPLGGAFRFERNGAGHITGQTTPMGSITLTVDGAGRPSRAAYADGRVDQFTRDANGRLLTTTGVSLGYDAAGRLSSSNGLAIGRDGVGRVSQVTLAPGKAIQYTYDRRGLCTQVRDWAGGVTTLQYDDSSRLISVARPNNVTTTYTYDADGDIGSIRESAGTAALSSIALTRDGRGLVVSADRNVPASPTPAQLAGAQTVHLYNAASQVADFPYDANGRRLSDETRSYTWNLAGHLTGYRSRDGDGSTQTYDGKGLLSTQSVGGVSRQFVWNHALALPSVSVMRSAGSDSLYLIHTPDGHLLHSVDPDGRRRFYHFDEQGNTLFVTDGAGTVGDKFAYSEYGAPLSPAATTEMFLFGGRDGILYLGSGLYSVRQRVYDSLTAAFLSPDAKMHLAPHLVSPYQFAAANPLLFTDVTGADPVAQGSAPVSTTALDVISGAGTAAGTTAAHLENAAEGTRQILEMVDFSEASAATQSAGLNAAKTVTKYKNIAKPLKTVAKAGTAAKVLSVGINAYNLNEGIQQAESEDDRNRDAAYRTYQNSYREINALYEAGKISAVQRNRLRLQAQHTFDEQLMTLDQQLLDNLLYEGFHFFTESMAQVPFVNDAAIAVGNQFYK